MNPFDAIIHGEPVYDENNDIDGLRHTVEVFADIGHPFSPHNILNYARLSFTSDRNDYIQEVAAKKGFYPDTILRQHLGLGIMTTPFISIGKRLEKYPNGKNGYSAFLSGLIQYAFTCRHDGNYLFRADIVGNDLIAMAINDGVLEDRGYFCSLSQKFRQLYIDKRGPFGAMGGKYEPL